MPMMLQRRARTQSSSQHPLNTMPTPISHQGLLAGIRPRWYLAHSRPQITIEIKIGSYTRHAIPPLPSRLIHGHLFTL